MSSPHLHTDPCLKRPDEFYKALAQLHDGRTTQQSLIINAKLVLMLANHIGDHPVLMEAIGRVRDNMEEGQ